MHDDMTAPTFRLGYSNNIYYLHYVNNRQNI